MLFRSVQLDGLQSPLVQLDGLQSPLVQLEGLQSPLVQLLDVLQSPLVQLEPCGGGGGGGEQLSSHESLPKNGPEEIIKKLGNKPETCTHWPSTQV